MLSLPSFISACTRYETRSFNLYSYDESINIIELLITEKVKSDYEARKAQYEIDTTNWNKAKRPKPFSPLPNYTDFEIEIIEIYKGKANPKITKLRASGLNSSCYWEPKIDESYIFYLDEIEFENGVEYIEISTSPRLLNVKTSYYHSEKVAIKLLEAKSEGKFKINPSNLCSEIGKYFPVQGKFKNGKRHGKWIIAEPVNRSSRCKIKPQKKVLVLNYKKGNLIFINYFSPKNENGEWNFVFFLESYYSERIK